MCNNHGHMIIEKIPWLVISYRVPPTAFPSDFNGSCNSSVNSFGKCIVIILNLLKNNNFNNELLLIVLLSIVH